MFVDKQVKQHGICGTVRTNENSVTVVVSFALELLGESEVDEGWPLVVT